MPAQHIFPEPLALAQHFKRQRTQRRHRVDSAKRHRPARVPLTKAERAQVLLKSGARCHICGGPIHGPAWDADHVFAHSAGGAHSLQNYLPAHSLCNQYRWNYGSEEFQWIMKLGVWLRTQIEHGTPFGITAAHHFISHDRKRAARRKPSPLPTRSLGHSLPSLVTLKRSHGPPVARQLQERTQNP